MPRSLVIGCPNEPGDAFVAKADKARKKRTRAEEGVDRSSGSLADPWLHPLRGEVSPLEQLRHGLQVEPGAGGRAAAMAAKAGRDLIHPVGRGGEPHLVKEDPV